MLWQWRYRRWVRKRCPHPLWRVECLHPEEAAWWEFINHESQCRECGKFLHYRREFCYWTGDPH